jgi:quinol monooxygenase YgiN
MSRYGLFGSIKAQPGKRDELLAILRDGAAAVADLPGCDIYIVSVSPDHPDKIWVTEFWRSQADHDASLDDERIRAIIAQARSLIAGMEDRVELEPLGGKGLPGAASS